MSRPDGLFSRCRRVSASSALVLAAGIGRFVDDPANGPGAPPTLGAAAEAAVDFAGATGCAFGCDRADLLVGNDVARTHDHDALSLRSVGLAAAVIQSPCDRTDRPLFDASAETPPQEL